MAGRGPDERLGRLAHLDRGEVKARPSGFPEERPERRNATGGAPEGRPAGNTAVGTLKGARPRRCAYTGAPLPLWREKEMKAAPRALRLPGPMSHACINADVMRSNARAV